MVILLHIFFKRFYDVSLRKYFTVFAEISQMPYDDANRNSVSGDTHLNQRSPLRDMREIRLILWGRTSDVSQTCEFLILPACLINYNARRLRVAWSWICTLHGGLLESITIYDLALNRYRISTSQTHAMQLRTIDRRQAPAIIATFILA